MILRNEARCGLGRGLREEYENTNPPGWVGAPCYWAKRATGGRAAAHGTTPQNEAQETLLAWAKDSNIQFSNNRGPTL